MSQGGQTAGVILTAIITSVVTSVATVLVVQRISLTAPAEKDEVIVPDLTGLAAADARINLENQGLVLLVAGRRPSPTARPDSIIAQSPLAASRVKKGSTVSVTLAGESPLVPDLTGRTVGEATVLLEQAGFKLFFGPHVSSATVEAGRIAKQEPAPGTSFEPGRTVVVNISDGPDAIEVPKVTGMNLNRAKETLEKAGFKVGATRWAYNEDFSPYIVLQQQPAAGEKAKPGSVVDLTVNED